MSSIFLSSLLACHRKRKVKKKRNTNKPHINNSESICKILQVLANSPHKRALQIADVYS